MKSPDIAVDELVARVRGRVTEPRDAAEIRTAFASVLVDLDVRPGDPMWTDGRDVIGAAYERVLRGRDRRALGQFFTPLSIGRAMAAWLLADQPRLLLDPACGSGSLLAAAAHERTGATTFAIHEGFKRRLGLDISQLASLHVLFLVRALEISAEGARLAFITP